MIYKGRYIRYFSLNHSSSNMSWMSVMLTIFLNGLVSLLRSPPFRQIRPLGNEFLLTLMVDVLLYYLHKVG